MVDPLSSSRVLAFRTVGLQALVTSLSAILASFFMGPTVAYAVAIGGASISAGCFAQAHLSLGGGVQPARSAYFRMLLGVIFKWSLVVLVWIAGMGLIAKAPLAALLGLTMAISIQPITTIFGAKVKREL